jgi:hypothetical protein
MHLRYLLPALVGALLLGGRARADFQFQFTDSTGAAASAFTINGIGNTVDIRVYLLQTGGSTNLTAAGLTDGGVSLQFSSSGHFTVSSASNITPNSAQFAGPNNTSLTTNAGTTSATLQVHNNSGVLAPTTGADANRILLGTFRFTGTSIGSGLTVTALPDPMNPNNVDGNGVNLDSMIHSSSASISVVPEPGSLILAGLAGSALCFGAWRRRRAAVTAN